MMTFYQFIYIGTSICSYFDVHDNNYTLNVNKINSNTETLKFISITV